MIEVNIPGRSALRLAYVVFDVNGTLAVDGVLVPGVKERLALLGQQVEIHLLTADTHGQQAAIDAELGLTATIIQHGTTEKGGYVLNLGADHVAAIGNGANDTAMFNAAALRIAVLGQEGLYADLLKSADVLVRDINDALDLLLNPRRLVATLRR
ncbi:MAG: ATPase P [Anaerolineae bacterium]|nr:ATPase P [Anaerolineae bacterium]